MTDERRDRIESRLHRGFPPEDDPWDLGLALKLSVEERLEEVWRLTAEQWTLAHGADSAERRLPRSVEVIRRG